VSNALEVTVKGWRAWAGATNLPSFAPEAVLRSALCLKLHAYNDTGAIIAAATTSVPAIGTRGGLGDVGP
jgi:GH15 family glucan-1,4-alpha-glucosidase